jgi:ethanolamine utilization cobalamin adenosyltransferase
VAVTLEERNEALAAQVAEMALTIKDLKKSLKFDRHIIESLKLDRTLEEKAVVTFLRGARLDELAEAILRGDHRKENP